MRGEQLRLFMEINENQKAVSKNLKNTLDADLKWNSSNLRERAEGLKKQLALDLGDEIRSPLYGRVLVGEDERSDGAGSGLALVGASTTSERPPCGRRVEPLPWLWTAKHSSDTLMTWCHA